jgi:hypothetical protein
MKWLFWLFWGAGITYVFGPVVAMLVIGTIGLVFAWK